jgi:acetyl esterase/lipase
MALRDAGVPLPGAGIFISPWIDLTLSGDSFKPGAVDDPVMDPTNLANMAKAYANDDLRNPRVSPFFGTIEQFPPSQVFAGTREYLLDDARRLAKALAAGRVPVEYYEGEGLIHCWAVMAPAASESTDCLNRISRFLGEHLEG